MKQIHIREEISSLCVLCEHCFVMGKNGILVLGMPVCDSCANVKRDPAYGGTVLHFDRDEMRERVIQIKE